MDLLAGGRIVIDVIVIAAVALAALGLTTFLVVKLLGAKDDQLAARDLYEKQIEATNAAIEDRNAFSVQLATERDKTKTLQDRLSTAESERNDATRALAAKVAEGIKNAPDAAAALAALNDILHAHLPGTGSTAAAGPGDGHREATAVQPATAAAAVPPGGHA